MRLDSDAAGREPSVLRVTTALRIGLAGLVLLVGTVIGDPRVVVPWYAIVGLTYLAGAIGWRVVLLRLPEPGRARAVGPVADVVFLLTLTALSGGPSSLLQPVFFIYPLLIAFLGVPWVTGLVGATITVGFLTGSLAFAASSAPVPVIWLHAAFLAWLAAGTTAMSAVMVRRERRLVALEQQQRDLVAQAVRIEERERAHLAEQLHDGPLQVLLAGRMTLGLIADSLPGPAGSDDASDAAHTVDAVDAADEIRSVKADLAQAVTQIRATIGGLHPQVLGQLGLGAAVRELADQFERRSGIAVDARIDPDRPGGTDRDFDTLMYGVARELLANVGRHARASRVELTLRHDLDGPSELVVADDGVGFDPLLLATRLAQGHIGLATLRSRITAAGGTVDISAGGPRAGSSPAGPDAGNTGADNTDADGGDGGPSGPGTTVTVRISPA